jgi:DNA repair protein RAD51
LPQGVAGLTKRDIQLIVDGGYNTVESVAYTPRRILEQIKGISEQKATKILTEGLCSILERPGLS